jgi:hypothetical protein
MLINPRIPFLGSAYGTRRRSVMRSKTLLTLFFAMSVGCGCASGREPDASARECPGAAPYCAPLYGRCCEDSFFPARCEAGEWICDPCVLDERLCGRPSRTMSSCEASVRDAARMDIPIDLHCALADGG